MVSKSSKRKKSADKTPPKPPDDSWKTADNIAQALEWHLANNPISEIATGLNITIEQARQLIDIGLDQKSNETFQETARLRLARLNLAVAGLTSRVSAGEDAAIALMMRLEAEIVRVKMLMAPDFKRIFRDRKLLALIGLEKLAEKPHGRPPHEPTEWSCGVVERMAIAGYPKDKIASVLGIDKATLDKYYSDIFETARPVFVTEAVTLFSDQAMKKAANGDSADVRWIISRVGPQEFRDQGVSLRFDPEKVDATANNHERTIRVIGGLPYGSTPENPGGVPEPKEGETIDGEAEIISETINGETDTIEGRPAADMETIKDRVRKLTTRPDGDPLKVDETKPQGETK